MMDLISKNEDVSIKYINYFNNKNKELIDNRVYNTINQYNIPTDDGEYIRDLSYVIAIGRELSDTNFEETQAVEIINILNDLTNDDCITGFLSILERVTIYDGRKYLVSHPSIKRDKIKLIKSKYPELYKQISEDLEIRREYAGDTCDEEEGQQ